MLATQGVMNYFIVLCIMYCYTCIVCIVITYYVLLY